MPSWDEFNTRKPDARPNERQARFDQLCGAVFSTGSGAELMKMLRAITIEGRVAPGASEAVLREHEAIRRFVAGLEHARDRGARPPERPKVVA